jgi:hypothetical protein
MADRSPINRTVLAAFAAIALAISVAVATAPAANSAPTWAPAASATVHPGVQMFTNGAQCTANFIYTQGTTVFIGQAAHCASLGSQTETNGCTTPSLPLGTPVQVSGAAHPGTLAYSSWLTMQAVGETDPDTCAYNDLALVQLDPRDVGSVNPSIPHWGGPVGVNTTGAPALSMVYSYGNSELRFGITLLSPKTGISLGDVSPWEHEVSTITPGIPGDSGSAFLDSQGRALGILSTLQVGVPNGVSNGVGDVGLEVAYAIAHGVTGLQLINGTEAFNPNQLPLGV